MKCEYGHNYRVCLYVLDKFLGDQRPSYNHDLTFKLSIGENSPQPFINDIILESGSGIRMTQAIFGQGNPEPSDTVTTVFILTVFLIHNNNNNNKDY